MNIFRKESLDSLDHPGQISEYVKVTTPPLYIMQVAMSVCCIVVVLWVAFGTVTEHVNSVAVVFPHDTPSRLTTDQDGQVEKIIVQKGSHVNLGDDIMTVRHGDELDTLRANTEGMLISNKEIDDPFRAYETLAEIVPEKLDSQNRELITYVKYKDLRSLKEGQEVQVTPVDLHREDYGYIIGHITHINHFPVREEDARRLSMIRNFADEIFPTETAYEVRLVVDTDDIDPTRLKWSRQQSQDITLGQMSFCNVMIITDSTPIYKMLFKH